MILIQEKTLFFKWRAQHRRAPDADNPNSRAATPLNKLTPGSLKRSAACECISSQIKFWLACQYQVPSHCFISCLVFQVWVKAVEFTLANWSCHRLRPAAGKSWLFKNSKFNQNHKACKPSCKDCTQWRRVRNWLSTQTRAKSPVRNSPTEGRRNLPGRTWNFLQEDLNASQWKHWVAKSCSKHAICIALWWWLSLFDLTSPGIHE